MTREQVEILAQKIATDIEMHPRCISGFATQSGPDILKSIIFEWLRKELPRD